MNLKDFYAQAILLDDNVQIVISFEINLHDKGHVTLSNCVKLFSKPYAEKLKKMLRSIEPFATNLYYIK